MSFLYPQTENTTCREDGDWLIMDDAYNFIFKIKHLIFTVSASPLFNEKFWILITLENSQILEYWFSRYRGIELHFFSKLMLFAITKK
jgi:hypothetical protein